MVVKKAEYMDSVLFSKFSFSKTRSRTCSHGSKIPPTSKCIMYMYITREATAFLTPLLSQQRLV